MGTSHFRVTAAVPGSSVTYVTVGFPRKSSSIGVGGSREVNSMKFFFNWCWVAQCLQLSRTFREFEKSQRSWKLSDFSLK